MKEVSGVELLGGSREERLPGYAPDFPCIASHLVMDARAERLMPWHWHQPVELFWVRRGTLVYMTPGGETIFPAGSGGMVASNVLHRTRPLHAGERLEQYMYIFDAALIADGKDGRIFRKYVRPVLENGQEIVALRETDARDRAALAVLEDSLALEGAALGYELRLRDALSQVWLRVYEKAAAQTHTARPEDERLKRMLDYIERHYACRLTTADIAAAGLCSQRACHRLFEQALRTTPGEYLRSCRLRTACRMLTASSAGVTEIAQACGFSGGSHFAQVFRQQMGMSPLHYRHSWQDSGQNRRECD